MNKRLFEDLQQSLKEVAAIRRSEIASGNVTEIHTLAVKTIRTRVDLTQQSPKVLGVQVAKSRNK